MQFEYKCRTQLTSVVLMTASIHVCLVCLFSDVINREDLETEILDAGAVVQIWPKQDKVHKVYVYISYKTLTFTHN